MHHQNIGDIILATCFSYGLNKVKLVMSQSYDILIITVKCISKVQMFKKHLPNILAYKKLETIMHKCYFKQ